MAAILELLLVKQVLPAEVVCWLARKYDTGQEPEVLQHMSNLRDEFVPYFVNLLRDDSFHLLQATRSTNSTPAKTPLSVKVNKNNGIRRTESPNEVATAGGSRTQLFGSPDVGGGYNRNPAWKQSPGAVCESPQLSDNVGRNKGRNTTKPPIQQRRRSSPYTDLAHTANGSLHKPDAHRSQHRHDLSAYFSAADLEQRLKHHQQSDPKDDCSSQSHSGRRPGNKKRRSCPSGDKRKQLPVNAETPPPVFNLVDNMAFPSLGDKEHTAQDRTTASASLPRGTKVITRSRRVATTLVTPTRRVEVTNSAFLNAPEGAVTGWGSGNPAKFVSLNLEKRLIGKVTTQTCRVDSRSDCQMDKGVDQGQTLTTAASAKMEKFEGQLVSSLSGVTPTKDRVGHSVSVTDWVTADRGRVTHKEALCLMADVYSGCLHDNLVPNLTVELYFVVQLLTARSAESPARIPARDDKESHHFDSVHNAVYFAVTVLSQQTSLLSMLDRGTLRLLADNRNIANFSPQFRQCLNQMYRDSPARPLPLSSSCLSPVGGVSFQADTDNRKNFPTDRAFHLFKKQRDLFYEVIRDWQECHMTPGWNMLETQGEKIRHLVGYRTELANHIHFARLFQSQLIQMCTGERSLEGVQETEEEHIALLSDLKQTNPDKFKRLQERFVMPSSLGLPCPPPSFPGWQEFFRDFVIAASSHVFNQHLLNTLATRVAQLNSLEFTPTREDERFDESEEDGISFIKCLSTLRLLGKYLGFVAFLPYQSPEILPDSVQVTYISMRNQSQQPVDVLHYIETALSTGRTVLTLPWVVEYLSMADALAPHLSYFTRLFQRLLVIHRLASEWFQQHQSHNSLLLLLILGWLFQLPVFPEGLFFRNVLSKVDVELMVAGSLDAMAEIDQRVISTCCPYLGEVRILLVDFAVGINSCSHNIRKITPVLTDTPAPSTVTDVQLQQQLEENFFSNHPASLKKTVEFVADRIASNFIKRFRAHTFPTMLEAGFEWVKELVRNSDDDIFDKRTKERLVQELQDYTGKTADASHANTRQQATGYCTEKAAAILRILLPEETPEQVLKVATCIVERVAAAKISAWMTTHVTRNMLKREFNTALDKQLKTFKISRNTNVDPANPNSWVAHPGLHVAMAMPLGVSTVPPGVCEDRKSKHDEMVEAPADVVIRFKGVLSRLMTQSQPGINTQTLCDTLQITKDMLNNRQDIIPGVYRALAKMSVDLAYVLVLKHPHMWRDSVERHLVALWRTHLWEHSLFHNVVCPKHMYLISESDDVKGCWQKLTELALCLLQNDIVKPEQMEPGLLRVLESSLTQGELKHLTVYICALAKFFHALHHGSTSEEFLCILDMLHAQSNSNGLERAHAAVQHTIDIINNTHTGSEVTGSSAGGSSAGGSSTGGSIHLGHDCTTKLYRCTCEVTANASDSNDLLRDHTVETDYSCNEVTVDTDHHCNKVTYHHCNEVIDHHCNEDTDHHCNKVTDHHCNEVTDHQCNKVTDHHCNDAIVETENHCNKVTVDIDHRCNGFTRGNINLLHDDTTNAETTNHCDLSGTERVFVGECCLSNIEAATLTIVTESTQHVTESTQHVTESTQHVTEGTQHVTESTQHVTESTQHVTESIHLDTSNMLHADNTCDCGSENISRLRISDGNDQSVVADGQSCKDIQLSGHACLDSLPVFSDNPSKDSGKERTHWDNSVSR